MRIADDHNVIEFMMQEVAEVNREKGWYDKERTFGDDIALLHSELSEALEAYRYWGVEDATEPPFVLTSLPPPKPQGVGSEFADVLVRLLDTCSRYDIDLFREWRRKVDYNKTREHRHGGRAL